MVEEREDVVGEGAESEADLWAERMASAVAAAFQADQPPIDLVAARLAHVAAEAVLEDERRPGAPVEVREADPVVGEGRHHATAACRNARVAGTSASARPCVMSGTSGALSRRSVTYRS
jgi:hypothetical protein